MVIKFCYPLNGFDKYYYHKHKYILGDCCMNQFLPSINKAIAAYLDSVLLARSENTSRTYRNAMNKFSAVLSDSDISPDDTLVSDLPDDAITWFTAALKDYAPSTERLYLTAATGFFEYLVAECLASPNLPRIRMLIRQRSRRPGQRLPQFPLTEIERLLDYANYLTSHAVENKIQRLRNLRDRAFLLILADTGLRVHEACALRRGDLDWNEGKAMVIGKGDRQTIIRVSSRALSATRDYLAARASQDGASGRPLTSLPLFARHDRGAGNKVKPITTTTGRNIVKRRVREALGENAIGMITPHSFRHYFVTIVLRASGNLKLAQELARHRNIAVTQRYAHLSDDELDKGYWEIFES